MSEFVIEKSEDGKIPKIEIPAILDDINKQLEDVNLEVADLQSQLASTKNLLGKISDKQTTLVNKMAAKPK